MWPQIRAIIGTLVLPVHTVAMAMDIAMSVRQIPSVVSVFKSRSASLPALATNGLFLKIVPRVVLTIIANVA